MKTLPLAIALTAPLMTGPAIAAGSNSSADSAASMPSQSHAKHEAKMRRKLSKKQCSGMPGDEKKDCQKNAGRDTHAAYKEATSASAGAGK